MLQPKDPQAMKIGVSDSGIGGLTVVRELMRQLPNESIVYFGDNRNCPYGNKDTQTLLSLAGGMLETLNKHSQLKLAALACNTTSTLIDQLIPRFSFPLFSVIEPTARRIALDKLNTVGIIATVVTASSGCYDKEIHRFYPDCQVFSQGSSRLAALIDSGQLDSPEIPGEIAACMEPLLAHPNMEQVVLACTHYPIVEELFQQACPHTAFINPAVEQAAAIRRYLEENRLLSENPSPTFEIFTTGSAQLYLDMCQRLGLRQPDAVYTV